MININNVTLVCVEGNNDTNTISKSIKSLIHSSSKINFGDRILISPKINEEQKQLLENNNILHKLIQQMDWYGYNNFILKELNNHIETDYCLIIQWDGFVLNPHLWEDEFLEYDYIGAKWDSNHLMSCRWLKPEVKIRGQFNLVGNGGFSLRSKKLLTETSQSPFECNGPEDAYICNNNYDYFVNRGIKFGSHEIADKFSREMNKSLSFDNVFGFHGEKDFIDKI
jgi:hypothetical protein